MRHSNGEPCDLYPPVVRPRRTQIKIMKSSGARVYRHARIEVYQLHCTINPPQSTLRGLQQRLLNLTCGHESFQWTKFGARLWSGTFCQMGFLSSNTALRLVLSFQFGSRRYYGTIGIYYYDPVLQAIPSTYLPTVTSARYYQPPIFGEADGYQNSNITEHSYLP